MGVGEEEPIKKKKKKKDIRKKCVFSKYFSVQTQRCPFIQGSDKIGCGHV